MSREFDVRKATEEFIKRHHELTQQFLPLIEKEPVKYLFDGHVLVPIESPLIKEFNFQTELLKKSILKEAYGD